MLKCVTPLLSVFILLVLILSGCDSQERMDHGDVSMEASDKVLFSVADPAPGPGSGIAVNLVPEFPTTDEDLKVVIHGASAEVDISWQVNGAVLSEATGSTLSSKYFSRGDRVAVTVAFAGEEVSTTTTVANSPPEIVALQTSQPPIFPGSAIEVIPEAVDADGDEVGFRYAWFINGNKFPWEDGPSLAGDNFQQGDVVEVTVIPFDGESEGRAFSKMRFAVEDAPPMFVTAPPETLSSFEFVYLARAVDPDGEDVEYRLAEGPEGMTIDGISGEVRWSIPPDEMGENRVRIIARNPQGLEAFQEFFVQIQKRTVNSD